MKRSEINAALMEKAGLDPMVRGEKLTMAELAKLTREMDFKLEQVQDFTPTPLTVSTTCWATGYHPYTLEKIFSAKTPEEKRRQNSFFFWYKKT